LTASTPSSSIAVTGIGLCVPDGVGASAALAAGRTGEDRALPDGPGGRRCASVIDFDPASVVKRRKALKLMGANIQFALAASREAWQASGREIGSDAGDAGIILGCRTRPGDFDELVEVVKASVDADGEFDPQRYGSEGGGKLFPLSMLRGLPNLVTAQVTIQLLLHGFSDTLTTGDSAGLQAIGEAVRVIQRGDSEALLAGGADDLHDPVSMARYDTFLGREGQPAFGQGAGVLMLEARAPEACGELPVVAAVRDSFRPDPSAEALRDHWQALLEAAGKPEAPRVLLVALDPANPARDRVQEAAGMLLGESTWLGSQLGRLGWSGAASGSIEAAFGALAIRDGELPPGVSTLAGSDATGPLPADAVVVATCSSEHGGLASVALTRGNPT
jgi:3-oxoacyl-[acyl-carrier-protein] synthase II